MRSIFKETVVLFFLNLTTFSKKYAISYAKMCCNHNANSISNGAAPQPQCAFYIKRHSAITTTNNYIVIPLKLRPERNSMCNGMGLQPGIKLYGGTAGAISKARIPCDTARRCNHNTNSTVRQSALHTQQESHVKQHGAAARAKMYGDAAGSATRSRILCETTRRCSRCKQTNNPI